MRYKGPEFPPDLYRVMQAESNRFLKEQQEFDRALRIATPIVGTDEHGNLSFQFNVSYIHNKPFSPGGRAYRVGIVNCDRHENLLFFDAVRLTAPYSMTLLRTDVGASHLYFVLKTMANIRSYGVIGKQRKGPEK